MQIIFDIGIWNIFLFSLFLLILTAAFYYVRKMQYLRLKNQISKQKLRAVKLIIAVCLSLFASLRLIGPDGLGGMDAIHYEYFFYSATGNFFDYLNTRGIEPLLLAFYYVVRLFTSDFRIAQFIFYLILIGLFFKASSKLDYDEKNKYVYLTFATAFLVAFCLVRNKLALAFGWLSLLYLIEGNNKKALLWVVPAILSHYSAAIILVTIIAYNFFKTTKLELSAVVAFCVALLPVIYFMILLVGYFVFSGRLAVYHHTGSFAIPTNLFRVAFLVFMIRCYNRDKTNERLKGGIIIFATSLFIVPLQLFAGISYRMMYFYFICIPIMVLSLQKTQFRGELLSKADVLKVEQSKRAGYITAYVYYAYAVVAFLISAAVAYGLYPYRL